MPVPSVNRIPVAQKINLKGKDAAAGKPHNRVAPHGLKALVLVFVFIANIYSANKSPVAVYYGKLSVVAVV